MTASLPLMFAACAPAQNFSEVAMTRDRAAIIALQRQ